MVRQKRMAQRIDSPRNRKRKSTSSTGNAKKAKTTKTVKSPKDAAKPTTSTTHDTEPTQPLTVVHASTPPQSPKATTRTTRVTEPNIPSPTVVAASTKQPDNEIPPKRNIPPQSPKPTTRTTRVTDSKVPSPTIVAPSTKPTTRTTRVTDSKVPSPTIVAPSTKQPDAKISTKTKQPPKSPEALVRRRSSRLAAYFKPHILTQEEIEKILLSSDSDDVRGSAVESSEEEDDLNDATSKKQNPQQQEMQSPSIPQTSALNDYEARRLERIRENATKLETLGLQQSPNLTNNMAESKKTRKGKEIAVDTSETDEEYFPQNDPESMFCGDDGAATREEATQTEVSTKKRGRPKKITEPTNAAASAKQQKVNLATSSKQYQTIKVSSEICDRMLEIDPASTSSELKRKSKFLGPRTLDWETLKRLNVDTQFNEWMTPAWKNFFNLKHQVYKNLTLEFFSTYKFNKNTEDVDSRSAMYFRLGGREFNLSFAEFAVAMNLYTVEEVKGEAFRSGITTWPSDVSPGDFWKTFGAGQYQKNLSCSSITKPVFKILHRAVAESINQRGKSTHYVTLDDLFYMYCIVNNTPCNVAKCLARYLYKGPGKTDSSAVCGGAYITQLALGLEVVTETKLLTMSVLGKTSFFDESQLRKLEIVEKDLPLRFVEHTNSGGGNADIASTTNANIASLCTRVTSIEDVLRWQNDALYFLIKKQGYKFDPPPHLLHGERATDTATEPAAEGGERAGDTATQAAAEGGERAGDTATQEAAEGGSQPVGQVKRSLTKSAIAAAVLKGARLGDQDSSSSTDNSSTTPVF